MDHFQSRLINAIRLLNQNALRPPYPLPFFLSFRTSQSNLRLITMDRLLASWQWQRFVSSSMHPSLPVTEASTDVSSLAARSRGDATTSPKRFAIGGVTQLLGRLISNKKSVKWQCVRWDTSQLKD
uniref:Uncharacterized protein n=1 Tax=Steinernema glaseri TaxID=37863 RepID=A0A1I7ZY83_9BILA